MNRRIFLSASFPTPQRAVEESGTYSSSEIGLAASCVIEEAFRAGDTLVFGGHPTISPLVLNLCYLFKDSARVELYQSQWFENDTTDEVARLLNLDSSTQGPHIERVMVPAGTDQGSSLQLMRERLASKTLHAGFFIGGMKGIEGEFDMFHQRQPHALSFLFTRPGGRAARIAEVRHPADYTSDVPRVEPAGTRLFTLNGRGYGALARRAFAEVQAQPA